MARLAIAIDCSIYSRARVSNCARLIFSNKCFGPEASEVINGMLISVSSVVESSCLAFSADSFSLCSASSSFVTSMPLSFLYSSAIQRIIFWSISSPPMWESPSVDLTTILWSPSAPVISKIEISKVPPPKSYTAIFSSLRLLKP